jgi:DNA primase large subunit
MRLGRLSDEERTAFVNANGLEYELVPDEEKHSKKECLCSFTGINPMNFSELRFYKVPFTQALDLISSRSVYLTEGYAYVPIPKLVSILVARFRTHLSRELIHAANMFAHVSADPRIGPLLKNMNKQYIGNDYSKTEVKCLGVVLDTAL